MAPSPNNKRKSNALKALGNRPPKRKNNKGRGKKTNDRKSKRLQRQQVQRKRSNLYNLRSNSVIIVSEVPCCSSEEQRKEYDKLGLNTALFCSSSCPAKRKQSHISVITISSSDEDLSKDRTVEWISTIEVDSDANSFNEEIPLSDLRPSSNGNRTVKSKWTQQHMSSSQIPISSTALTPLCLSTPQGEHQTCKTQMKLMESSNAFDSVFPASINSETRNLGDTVNPSEEPPNQIQIKDTSTVTNTPQFYFGSPNSFQNSSYNPPILSNYMFCGTNPLLNTPTIPTSDEKSYEPKTPTSEIPFLLSFTYKSRKEDHSTESDTE